MNLTPVVLDDGEFMYKLFRNHYILQNLCIGWVEGACRCGFGVFEWSLSIFVQELRLSLQQGHFHSLLILFGRVVVSRVLVNVSATVNSKGCLDGFLYCLSRAVDALVCYLGFASFCDVIFILLVKNFRNILCLLFSQETESGG